MVIEINKDIDRYQETVAMGLTAKQLIYSIISVTVGAGIVLLLYKYIGLTGSAYVAIPCVAPIALGGFYSFNGMSFFTYWKKKLHFMFANKTYTYISTEGAPAIKRIEMENTTKKGKTKLDNKEQIMDESDVIKKKEEFEASKKKMKNMLMLLGVVLGFAIIAAVTYKYFK